MKAKTKCALPIGLVGWGISATAADAQTTSSSEAGGWIAVGIAVAVCIGLFLVPTFIAFRRRSRYRYIILILNLSFSFTGIGWLAILVWSLWPSNDALPVRIVEPGQSANRPSVAVDLERQPAQVATLAEAESHAPGYSAAQQALRSSPPAGHRPVANPFREFFARYFDFSGRTSRKAYWLTLLVMGPLWLVGIVVAEAIAPGSADSFGPVSIIVILATTIPWLSLAIRRLHDIGRSGWWQLIQLTGIGAIVLLVWNCLRGEAEANKFGPSPTASTNVPGPSGTAA